jgi:hypothetical protein
MRRSLRAALVLALAACSRGGDGGPAAAPGAAETTLSRPSTTVRATTTTTTRPPERLTTDTRLRMDGIGPIRVGMTVDQATDGRVLTRFRSGLRGAVARPEGCA